MGEFIVGRYYLPAYELRGMPYWSSPFGYKVFERAGYLFTIDGDGDERPLVFLNSSEEVLNFPLENE